ncbi:MAG TPA: hypothetical protein VEH79_00800 [Gaiellaceae bacterium]|nr:hypothetical protein [Gaiellaceae bacterium]
MTRLHRSKWFLPVFSLAIGGVCLAAFWIGGDRNQGLISLAIMGGFGLLVLLGGRSELVRGLRGDGKDEYWASLDLRATTLSGLTVLLAIIVMCLWEWAHGRNGSPYAQLGAIGGVAYITAVGLLRWRG